MPFHDEPWKYDNTHRGPNQAGNKSLLSYRADKGVPGYTGYIPGHASIVLPIRFGEHTGKPVDSTTRLSATVSTVEPKSKATEYLDKYRKVPSDTKPTDKGAGGYWLSQATGLRSVKDGDIPFIASTTYREEVLNKEDTAAKQMASCAGLACTLPKYEVARERARATNGTLLGATTGHEGRAGPSFISEGRRHPTERPATCMTSAGEVVGYQTTKGTMRVQNPLTGGTATGGYSASERPRPATTPALEVRYQTMPRAMPPGMFGDTSSYERDFGVDTSDPLRRGAPTEKFMTRLATTRELAEGTTRNNNHLPGYTGHMSAYKANELARAQSDAADERINAKNDMTLYHLDQFSRSRVPGYTGFKPKAAVNITMDQPFRGAPTETTQGAAGFDATKRGVPPVDHTHHNNSKAGIMTFFTSTGQYVSDNGLSNAQLYYSLVRPGDGRFKMTTLPHQTAYGAPFNPRNSLV